MLQEFLRRGKKMMGRQTWFQFQGSSAELGVCSRPGFSPRWKICQKTAMEAVDFAVDFRGGFFWSQNAKEIRRNIRQPKTKNPPAHDPPEIRQPNPKIRRKTYQQIRLSNLQVHAGFLRWRSIALGGIFRAWILGHSSAAFWAGSGLPC